MTRFKDVFCFYLGCRVMAAPYGGQSKRYEAGKFVGMNIHDIANVKLDAWQSVADISVSQIKPILRRIEDITDAEIKEMIKWDEMNKKYQNMSFERECESITIHYSIDTEDQGLYPMSHTFNLWNPVPEYFVWLLQNWFDLFGLIKSDQAIDAKTIQNG